MSTAVARAAGMAMMVDARVAMAAGREDTEATTWVPPNLPACIGDSC